MHTAQSARRLLVTRQHPETRRYECVGELAVALDGRYTFRYEDGVTRPLPGLPLRDEHISTDLFAIFADRVIHPSRPDYEESLHQLGLDLDAGPFEVLAVSGGRRTGDAYELTPVPTPGPVELPFLVHGIRHLSEVEQQAVDRLTVGDALQLRQEPDNPVNERALLVTTAGTRLGYVPDPLVEYVHDIIRSEHGLVVTRVNPASAGFHMRLLVTLRGRYSGHG